MFQTEPLVYLQSLGPQWFTFLMILITNLGSSRVIIAITVIAIFGVDFKKGFLLLQLLLWTGLIIEILKVIVAFPRPDFVDNRVLNLEYGIKSPSSFIGNGEKGFLELPDKQILNAFRLQDTLTHYSFGFPSGHSALTTALWGGSSIVFKSKMLRIITPLAVSIVAFSRVYLGRHFIGDVLGGAVVGLILLIVFSYFLKSSFKDDLFKKENFELVFRQKNLLFYSFMFVIPICFMALSLISTDAAGFVLGTNVAYLLIIRKGIPDNIGNPKQKATRAFIALLLLGISSLILDLWFNTEVTTNYVQFSLIGFLKTFIPASAMWPSVVVCRKLDLYK